MSFLPMTATATERHSRKVRRAMEEEKQQRLRELVNQAHRRQGSDFVDPTGAQQQQAAKQQQSPVESLSGQSSPSLGAIVKSMQGVWCSRALAQVDAKVHATTVCEMQVSPQRMRLATEAVDYDD